MHRLLSWVKKKILRKSPTPPPSPQSAEASEADTSERQPSIVLLSDNHITYNIYIHGEEFGEFLGHFRSLIRSDPTITERLYRRDTVEEALSSPEPTPFVESSVDIPSISTQSKSSAQTSHYTTLSISAHNSSENKPRSYCCPCCSSEDCPEDNASCKQSRTGARKKTETACIQQNSKHNLKKRVTLAADEQRPPSPQAGPSIVKKAPTKHQQVSFDAIDTDFRHPHLNRQDAARRRSVSFESLSSVSYFTDTSTSSIEINIFENFSSESRGHRTAQINRALELRRDLSQSKAICYAQKRAHWIHNNITYSPCPTLFKKRHYLPEHDFEERLPAPAPSASDQWRRRYYEKAIFVKRSRSYESEETRFKIDDGDQWWSASKAGLHADVTTGRRVSYVSVASHSEHSWGYETIEPEYNTHELPFQQDNCYKRNDPSQVNQNQPPNQRRRLEGSTAGAHNIQHRPRSKSDSFDRTHLRKKKGKMNSMDDHERKIIIEFCHLLEKSKQLFNGLRELPQYGHKQWSLYFGRTFDIYTRLWKYQQQHRVILDSKYGMKRWQIGEIASKIGQLYYHFYLRTSETAYLNEAYSFYYAIRGRCYYTKANKEDKCELMVKKLRYYARFIVVCLLLKKIKLVKDLIKELDRQIIEYGNTYDPEDQVEWTEVVEEVKAFIHAEPVVSVIHPDNYSVIMSNRLTPHSTPAIERSAQMNLTLQEILIVGSSSQQVRFSELTMDMFRMLQTLERVPTGEVQHVFDESPRARYTSPPHAHSQDATDGGPKIPNPHKYLLFKPSPSQMLIYLSSGCNELPANGIMLLYVSADGLFEHPAHAAKHPEDATGYEMGGLITTSKNDIYRDCGNNREKDRERERDRDNKDQKPSTPAKPREPHCLYPGDLNAYTRKPFFLIVDSDNSFAFQYIPKLFNQPMVTLMSPLELPPSFHDRRQQGSLFTLFLHSPLSAICYCCDVANLSLVHWERGLIYVQTFIAEASAIFVRSRVDLSYITFMGDDFLRLLILRFVFCEVVLRLHRGFRSRAHLTRSNPPIPEDIFEHPALIHIVIDLTNHLQIRSHFHDPTVAAGPPTTKE